MVLLLSAADLARVLEVGAVVDAVQAAFAAYSAGRTVTPLRVGVEPPGQEGVLLAMPCAVIEPPSLGTKLVAVYRGNPGRGLPLIHSVYVLADFATGQPLAIMDGGYLTAIRTGAGSAVATRLLARPEAKTLGVFGTGVQARHHVACIAAVRALERVLVVGTSSAKAAAFAAWVHDELGLEAAPASAAEAAGADVLAVCTTSPQPVVPAEAVRPGAHINAVGAFTPSTRELPTALVQRASVYVDTRAGAEAEAGDLLIPVQEGAFSVDRIRGELGQLVLGQVPGRGAADEVSIYKSVGAAFLDAATAQVAVARAHEAGIGQQFDLAGGA